MMGWSITNFLPHPTQIFPQEVCSMRFALHAVITCCRLWFSRAMFYAHLFHILHRAEHLSHNPPFRLIYPNTAFFPVCLCTALQLY